MFEGIGFFELLLVLILALVVLGPERLPALLTKIHKFNTQAKQMLASTTHQIEHELKFQELHHHLKQAESATHSALSPEIEHSVKVLKESAQSVTRPYQDDTELFKKG
tara:strand:- start:336 stop:659 length:324 start_codon:yes stop_codon:yes gene_type:complete